MSKLRYSASASYSSSVRPKSGLKTYSFEPIRPDSSAPHHAKRSVFCGVYFLLLPSASATVRIVAEPVPLSWMPGPSPTESRWAPNIDDVVGVDARQVGDDVLGRVGDDRRVGGQVDRRPRSRTTQPVAVGRVEDRDGQRADDALTERAADDVLTTGIGGVALVEDDDGLGAGRLGVDGLEAERTGAALDQRDVGRTAEVEPGEVGGLTARRRARCRARGRGRPGSRCRR